MNNGLRKHWRVMGENLEDEYMFLKRNDIPFHLFYKFTNPANNYCKETEGDTFEIITETVEQETMLKLFFGERLDLLISFYTAILEGKHG